MVCSDTANGVTIKTFPGIHLAHSSCIKVLPMPQSANIQALPRRKAHETISCCSLRSLYTCRAKNKLLPDFVLPQQMYRPTYRANTRTTGTAVASAYHAR